MGDSTKSIRSIVIQALVAMLVGVGGLAFAAGPAAARHSPQPWRLKPQGEGTVRMVNVEQRTVTVTHDGIDLLNWPATTTKFGAAPGVNLGALRRGERIVFTVTRGKDGRFIIQEIRADN